MKRGGSTYTVDWAGPPDAPQVDNVFARMTPTSQHAGYYRVTAVRIVNTRKPLDAGYRARYRINADFIGEDPPLGVSVDWTLYAHPRLPRPPKPPGRFSPLL